MLGLVYLIGLWDVMFSNDIGQWDTVSAFDGVWIYDYFFFKWLPFGASLEFSGGP